MIRAAGGFHGQGHQALCSGGRISRLPLAYLQLAASMALVGVNVGVAKLLAEVLPIPLIACLRCILACLVLWPLAHALGAGCSRAGRLLVFHSLTASVI